MADSLVTTNVTCVTMVLVLRCSSHPRIGYMPRDVTTKTQVDACQHNNLQECLVKPNKYFMRKYSRQMSTCVGSVPSLPATYVGSVPSLPATYVGSVPSLPATYVGNLPSLPATYVGSLPSLPATYVGILPSLPATYVGSVPSLPATYVGSVGHHLTDRITGSLFVYSAPA